VSNLPHPEHVSTTITYKSKSLTILDYPGYFSNTRDLAVATNTGQNDIAKETEVFLLSVLAWVLILVAAISFLWIAIDEVRHPQKMTIMNVVWPVSALYFSLIAVWAYYLVGQNRSDSAMHGQRAQSGDKSHSERSEPSVWQVAVGTSHCGAGCMLADVLCEFVIAAAGITLFGSVLWAEYAIDFAAAWALGIVFQYFAIMPMRNITPGQGIIAAIKADTLSISAFQIGMYAYMALTFFVLFPHHHLTPFDPRYWLMMQIAMICGFFTSYPVN
jgi:hypothetical protein